MTVCWRSCRSGQLPTVTVFDYRSSAMASWMWVLIFLVVVTAIVFAVLWSSGILSAAAPGGDRNAAPDAEPAAMDPATDSDWQARQSARRRTAAPPPAMAGDVPGVVDRAGRAASGGTVARPRSAAPPPAGAGGRSDSGPAQSSAKPIVRTSKAPPVQAAWSTPPNKTGE